MKGAEHRNTQVLKGKQKLKASLVAMAEGNPLMPKLNIEHRQWLQCESRATEAEMSNVHCVF